MIQQQLIKWLTQPPLQQSRSEAIFIHFGAANLDERGVQLATIRRFSVGSFHVKGKEVGVMDLRGLIHGDLLQGSPPVAGLLGSEFLRRNHGIIDFGTGTLYLKL